jgi:hypothetical protein
MEEYPQTAFALTLVGAILSLITGIIFSFVEVLAFINGDYSNGVLCISLSLLGSILGLISAFLMKDPDKVHSAGALAIIAALFSLVNVLGFIFMLIGGILALTWEKPKKVAIVYPPPPPT